MEVIIGSDAEIIRKAQVIRNQVFTVEQGIPQELDLDGLDETSHHLLMTDNDDLVATARLTPKQGGASVMARVAVLKAYRGCGLASKIVEALIEYANNQGIDSIEIHAHEYLKEFYERFGFSFVQQVEVVGEHQLIEMQYQASITQ
ncbi:GNAT family N-acetyltransferase [Vibrio breoganii]|nr:GNAT family N-acetyltransferase [Vibrio breoganii]PMG96081.1 GNAT family N-acetyltransferase [Vibrio breoganii]PMJ44935.1 GNAT family N-acetyltransferase [Vibrio breoganii]PMK55775.1 GNAT family N-acetyltransferase [Vibrio breoganii]PMK66997.1 GNAT family N-acetyltransferase [Vibrio breoganii]PML05395.1 GNAT family N-acetyltransferase [Vibrio breoganii]